VPKERILPVLVLKLEPKFGRFLVPLPDAVLLKFPLHDAHACYNNAVCFRTVTMMSETHWSNVGKTMLEFKRNDFLCDTILITKDGQLKAHGVLLAAVSPVFKRALEASQSNASHLLNFPEIDAALLEILLHFAYTGKLVLPSKFSHKKELPKIFDALQTLGLDLNQLNGSEIKFAG